MMRSCCLRNDRFDIGTDKNLWQDPRLKALRETNKQGVWDPGCSPCYLMERAGLTSFRTGMNRGLDTYGRTDLSGPARLDIMFDISCNLACRTCDSNSSTFWQKHLQDIGEWDRPIFTPRNKSRMIEYLAELDLSNLRQVVFCGGETLLGQEYWDVAQWLVEHTPDAKQNLTLCFQTNGTQPILEKNHDIIDSCRFVKLQISLDGVQERFEYLRWPAQWQPVTQNLQQLRDHLPPNVIFLVEQTISIFTILTYTDVERWVKENFSQNRLGINTPCCHHLAHGIFGLHNCSQRLVDHLGQTPARQMVPNTWQENPDQIKLMLDTIKKYDRHRAQSLEIALPEVWQAYRDFW